MSREASPSEIAVLTGFMGAGKSTVGPLLAERLGWEWVDLDEEIVRRQKRSIAEIFERQGEATFRQLEYETLRQSLGKGRRVIAVGGGALVAERNRHLLAGVATTFWLDPGFDAILSRMSPEQRALRPLFRDSTAARYLHDQRLVAYGRANHRIAIAEGETADRVAARIENLVRHAGPQGC